MTGFGYTRALRMQARYWLTTCRRRWGSVLGVAMVIAVFMYATRGLRVKTVNVHVVEEHHEVLMHWHRETIRRSINDTANTLIHIDAHSDLGLPDRFPGFRFSQWPKDETLVHRMMQKNDVFIMGAAAIGLFDHIIWIWPSWDSDLEPAYEALEFGIGYTKKTGGMCECHMELDKTGQKIPGHIMCAKTDSAGEDILKDPSACKIKKSVLVEKVRDDLALEMLKQDTWMRKLKTVLLDIDEDYFGCESGFDGLAETNISVETAISVNEKLTEMICPLSTSHEELADKLIRHYIWAMIQFCELSTPRDRCTKDIRILRAPLDIHLTDSYKKHPEMFCSNTALVVSSLMKDLLSIFHKLSLESLTTILNLGFCLSTSPVTFGFSDGVSEYTLCHGANLPGQSVVNFHTPSQLEVSQRMVELHGMLDLIEKSDPKVVTICRSVRDGYTPRDLANAIENGILEYFKKRNLENDRPQYEILFDQNLLGGEAGWAGRYNVDMFNKFTVGTNVKSNLNPSANGHESF